MSAGAVAGRSRRGVAFGAAVVVLTIVAVSVALVIWRTRPSAAVHGTARFSGARTITPMPSLLPPATLAEPVRVALLRDPSAVTYYDRPATFDAIVERWRDVMTAAGADVRVAAPSERQWSS